MPSQNQFRHQSYPTAPTRPPAFFRLQMDDSEDVDFSVLHTSLRLRRVILVHGTFMGNDPIAAATTLTRIAGSVPAMQSALESLASSIRNNTKPITDRMAGDVGNYTDEFRDRFQNLVGDDPLIELLQPTWSGQNHHLARADLAVRLLCRLADLQPAPDQRVLLWGHSHAGNAFAILTNLLANERSSVQRFFTAAGTQGPHWARAREILANSATPHPWAASVLIAAFATPVRYGWDLTGCASLLHILHHCCDEDHSITTKPLFPAYSVTDLVTARYGDWVQAFGIAGTDTQPPIVTDAHVRMSEFLESGLPEPKHELDTRLIIPERVRDLCARLKTGTRCHADGKNLLVCYEPCGRRNTLNLPIEQTMFGHGVATTVDWLPAHLGLVLANIKQ